MADKFPDWTPFERSTPGPLKPGEIERLAAATGTSLDVARRVAEECRRDEYFVNSRYQVAIRRTEQEDGPMLVHLSIRRLDRKPVGRERFRDFQRIKTELVGPDCEGVELYPAESRLVDMANQYHLWCVADPAFRFPFGFGSRMLLGPIEGASAVQAPFT
jgi:hypothetical protein